MKKRKVTAIVLSCAMIFTMAANVSISAMAEGDTPDMDKGNIGVLEKKAAPELKIPEGLTGTAGAELKEVELPSGWAWVDENGILSEDVDQYTARYYVDDETYDYSEVEGYDAEAHCVERALTVAVTEAGPNSTTQQKPQNNIQQMAAGDVAIDGTSFPDKTFREYIKETFDKDKDGTLSQDEISEALMIDFFVDLDAETKGSIKSLKGIEYLTALGYLDCSSTGISELDVSANPDLILLDCSNTGVSKLDVSKNSKLSMLRCENTKVEVLDVTQNPALSTLDCSGTGIEKIDVSQNPNLQFLYCSDTEINGLDISKNSDLIALECLNCPLAWLNLGVSGIPQNVFDIPASTEVTLDVTEDQFDITQEFPGIDVSKISNLSGATLEGNIVKEYSSKQPISYTYDCGTNNGEQQTLKVTLRIGKEGQEPGSGSESGPEENTTKPEDTNNNNNSSNNNNTNKETGSAQIQKTVKTGDDTTFWIWGMAAVFSFGLIVFAVQRKIKNISR